MLHEAMNGFSTVFSGAMFRSDTAKLFSPDKYKIRYLFKKVKNIAELNGMEPVPDNNGGVIGILCWSVRQVLETLEP